VARDHPSVVTDLDGYSFNMALLTRVFSTRFELLDIGATGPSEVTARCALLAERSGRTHAAHAQPPCSSLLHT